MAHQTQESTTSVVLSFFAVDDFEHRMLVQALREKLNELISEGKSTEDINALLLKVIDAKPIKKKKRSTY